MNGLRKNTYSDFRKEYPDLKINLRTSGEKVTSILEDAEINIMV